MEKPAGAPSSASENAQQSWTLNMVGPIEPGIVCIDIDRMLKFYTGVLGFKLVSDAETTPENSLKFRTTPHGYRIVRLQPPTGGLIKLVQPRVPPAQIPVPEWVYERQGIAYVTFIVNDMQRVVARLTEHNVKLVSDAPVEMRKGVFGLYTLDPEGNYVEFVQFANPVKK
jgi:lactoylglutathione lyase